jgi:hypothetical protein
MYEADVPLLPVYLIHYSTTQPTHRFLQISVIWVRNAAEQTFIPESCRSAQFSLNGLLRGLSEGCLSARVDSCWLKQWYPVQKTISPLFHVHVHRTPG